MKRYSLMSALVLSMLVALCACGGGGGGGSSPPPFSQADLTGTWYVSILQTSATLTSSSEPGWIRGTATVSSSGTISVPIMETSTSTGTGPADVVWTIDPWTGIISESGADGNPDFHGKLSANKQLIVGTATNLNSTATTTTAQLRIIQKIATSPSYTISDIANKTFMIHQIESGAGDDWMYATGATGTVFSGMSTTGTLSMMTTPSGTSPGGDIGLLSISPSGIMSLSTNTWFKGMVSADKTYMVATENSATDSNVFRLTVVQFIDSLKSYSLSDLAGTWRNHSILSAGAWLYSTATINTTGMGTITDEHTSISLATGPSYTFDLTISASGIVSEPTTTSSHAFLSPSKDLLVMTQTITGPGSFMAVMVK